MVRAWPADNNSLTCTCAGPQTGAMQMSPLALTGLLFLVALLGGLQPALWGGSSARSGRAHRGFAEAVGDDIDGPNGGAALAAPAAFITVRGTGFFEGCRPYFMAGTNIWALTDLATGMFNPYRADGSSKDGRVVVQDLLRETSRAGLNVVRFFLPTVSGREFATLSEPRGALNESVLLSADWVSFSRSRYILRKGAPGL